MAEEFGWTLDYIRAMSATDFDIFTTMIGVKYRVSSKMIAEQSKA